MVKMSIRLLLLPMLSLTDHTLGKFSWLKSSGMASALLVEVVGDGFCSPGGVNLDNQALCKKGTKI